MSACLHTLAVNEEPTDGSIVYVPDFKLEDNGSLQSLGRRVGGWATVNRVSTGLSGEHFVSVFEHGTYFEMSWENFLRDQQEMLRDMFGIKRAELK